MMSRNWTAIERLPEIPGVVKMTPKEPFRAEIARMLLDYNPATGLFTWRARPRTRFKSNRCWLRWAALFEGRPALTNKSNQGYMVGGVLGWSLKAHRLAWACHYGEWPKGKIDHINGIRHDNRIANLRVVDDVGNARNRRWKNNNKSGVTGVDYAPRLKRWIVRIGTGGARKHIGVYKTFEDAVAARRQAERQFGYHPNHGVSA